MYVTHSFLTVHTLSLKQVIDFVEYIITNNITWEGFIIHAAVRKFHFQ